MSSSPLINNACKNYSSFGSWWLFTGLRSLLIFRLWALPFIPLKIPMIWCSKYSPKISSLKLLGPFLQKVLQISIPRALADLLVGRARWQNLTFLVMGICGLPFPGLPNWPTYFSDLQPSKTRSKFQSKQTGHLGSRLVTISLSNPSKIIPISLKAWQNIQDDRWQLTHSSPSKLQTMTYTVHPQKFTNVPWKGTIL